MDVSDSVGRPFCLHPVTFHYARKFKSGKRKCVIPLSKTYKTEGLCDIVSQSLSLTLPVFAFLSLAFSFTTLIFSKHNSKCYRMQTEGTPQDI